MEYYTKTLYFLKRKRQIEDEHNYPKRQKNIVQTIDEDDVLLIDSDYRFSDEEDNIEYRDLLNKKTPKENEIIRSSIVDLTGDDEAGSIISITSSVEESSSDEDNDDDDFSSTSNTNDSYNVHDIIDLTVEDDDIISITSSVEESSSDEDNDDDDFSSTSNTNDSYNVHDIIDPTVKDDDIISIHRKECIREAFETYSQNYTEKKD
ncbi:uncharacterized protein LOC126549104 isoform X3 [Aphis gossypii]|uniref:uncharacterized protein LOC126549104 isoform X3 n=1 Tax=Aphis gossypii TaxID=80765 RepID=UPI0021597EB4|nr:uncharacterized protein LOC126549104 isoform X3 [Aphis gossypii]